MHYRTWWKIYVMAVLSDLRWPPDVTGRTSTDWYHKLSLPSSNTQRCIGSPSQPGMERTGRGGVPSPPQGSQLIPYAWFLALEVKDRETLVRETVTWHSRVHHCVPHQAGIPTAFRSGSSRMPVRSHC